jgi:hypothetical protein
MAATSANVVACLQAKRAKVTSTIREIVRAAQRQKEDAQRHTAASGAFADLLNWWPTRIT